MSRCSGREVRKYVLLSFEWTAPLTNHYLLLGVCETKCLPLPKNLTFPSKPRCKYWRASDRQYGSDCQISTARLIYLHSIKIVMKSTLSTHQHTQNEMQRSLPLVFNWNGSVTWQHITLTRVHILNRIQLAEHWGGILCKFLITSVHDWIYSGNSQKPAHIQRIYPTRMCVSNVCQCTDNRY